jgi:hypothetical protein
MVYQKYLQNDTALSVQEAEEVYDRIRAAIDVTMILRHRTSGRICLSVSE